MLMVNNSFHWVGLDYIIENNGSENWGPVAIIHIITKIELPKELHAEREELRGTYRHLRVRLTDKCDPQQQIIQAIEKLAKEENIKIELDWPRMLDNPYFE